MNSERCSQCKHFIIANAGEGKIYGCDRSKCVFEPITKNDLGVDDEERELALMYLEQIKEDYIENVGYERHPLPEYYAIETAIKLLALPPVTPQEPRKGHWIIDTHKIRAFGKKYETHDYSVHCDKCNYAWDYTTDKHGGLVSNFCPNCGADMREAEE